MISFKLSRVLRGPAWGLGLALFVAASFSLVSCKKDKPKTSSPEPPASPPTLRIYALSGAAGAIEPCGCVKDMLGGIDHAAAFISAEKKKAPNALVLGAGPMFFENPYVEPEKKAQQMFKAEAMAQSLNDVGLVAWAPGANDWAAGVDDFIRLHRETGARALGANLKDAASTMASAKIQSGSLSVGLIGISLPKAPTGSLPVTATAAEPALLGELKKLGETDVNVALIAAQRGEALRLIERINQKSTFIQVAILGKAFDQGENNDQPIPPEVVENALVVQAPNHLQAISVIDLYVRDGTKQFSDGTGLSIQQKQVHLTSRIDELERRLERWKAPGSPVKKEEIVAKEDELRAMKTERAALHPVQPPEKGSYFLYDLVFVKESLGKDKEVSSRLSAYYRRVNEHNKQAFADRLPQAAAEGQPSYVGVNTCSNCHVEERAFWDTTGHANAYFTLQSQNKEYNLECVSCHVTGYEQPGGSTVTHVDELKSVQCEVCHGPGSLHAENPGLKDAISAAPARSLCASSCHHEPHVGADWNVDVAWPQIIGPGHGR